MIYMDLSTHLLHYRSTNLDNMRDLHFLVRRRVPHSFRPVGGAG